MEFPKELKYTKSHEWVKFSDDTTAQVGITDYAQQELGGIVFVNLPEEGDELTAGTSFAEVESVKAVSDIYAPVSGTVSQINEELLDSPEMINEGAYEAWFVTVSDISDREEMLSAEEYAAFVEEEKAKEE